MTFDQRLADMGIDPVKFREYDEASYATGQLGWTFVLIPGQIMEEPRTCTQEGGRMGTQVPRGSTAEVAGDAGHTRPYDTTAHVYESRRRAH